MVHEELKETKVLAIEVISSVWRLRPVFPENVGFFLCRRGAVNIADMSVGEICVLRKLSLLKLTSLLELYTKQQNSGSQDFKPTK